MSSPNLISLSLFPSFSLSLSLCLSHFVYLLFNSFFQVFIKQQMAAVYHDFSLRSTQWEAKEKHLRDESSLIKSDRDDSKLQLKRTEEILVATADSGVQAEQFIKLGTNLVFSLPYSYLFHFFIPLKFIISYLIPHDTNRSESCWPWSSRASVYPTDNITDGATGRGTEY